MATDSVELRRKKYGLNLRQRRLSLFRGGGIAQLILDRAPAGDGKGAGLIFESGISSLCPWEKHFTLISHWAMQSTRRVGLVRLKTCKQNRKKVSCIGVVDIRRIPGSY